MDSTKLFLFSVDLEEFYAERPDFRRTSLPELAERYLELLRRHQMKATFFVVGELAEQFRSTIREIHAEGHELACHTYAHLALNQYDPGSFEEDLKRNLDAIRGCVEAEVVGFRAPILSLTEKTQWAYEVLAKLGFQYSSSVLSSTSPLHGWPGFGNRPRRMNGVLELPVTLARFLWMRVPVGSGTYFRCLPFAFTRWRLGQCARVGTPVIGYFHPYDADFAQEKVMSRGVGGSRLLNSLLYVNRSQTVPRLERILSDGFKIVPYRNYLTDYISHE
jgi:polysaccharide deacetylase family protein (PEP-CTERM system associated)